MEKTSKIVFGCFGNGVTAFETSDNEIIAHISETGHVEYYIPRQEVSDEDVSKIEAEAKRVKEKFLKRWNTFDYIQKWNYMMDIPTIGCGYTAVELVDKENKDLSIKDRVPLMEEAFFNMHM